MEIHKWNWSFWLHKNTGTVFYSFAARYVSCAGSVYKSRSNTYPESRFGSTNGDNLRIATTTTWKSPCGSCSTNYPEPRWCFILQ